MCSLQEQQRQIDATVVSVLTHCRHTSELGSQAVLQAACMTHNEQQGMRFVRTLAS